MSDLVREHLIRVGARFIETAKAHGHCGRVGFEDNYAGHSFERDAIRAKFKVLVETDRGKWRRGIVILDDEFTKLVPSTDVAASFYDQLITNTGFLVLNGATLPHLEYPAVKDGDEAKIAQEA